MRLRTTIEFIGLWEQINNTDFNMVEFDQFKNEEDPDAVIANWIRRADSLQFLAIWEKINNKHFKPTDFGGFKSKPGENAFIISPQKWIEKRVYIT